MRFSLCLVSTVIAAVPAFAQIGVAIPVGQNLRDRPEQAGDIVLDVDRAGAYVLNGGPVAATQLVRELSPLVRHTHDYLLYIRADAHLSAAAITSAAAIAAGAGACVASFVGAQERGTSSRVSGDAGPQAGDVRRAIDVQLSLPHPTQAMSARQGASAIVLEVLPGPAYRINTQPVSPGDLQRRLLEIFNPRPLKILFVRADTGASYQDVFHAMDAARYAGVIDIAAAPRELAIRTKLPDIDLTTRVTPRDDSTAEHLSGNVGRCRRGDIYFGEPVSPTGGPPSGERVYFEFQVEQRATLVPGSDTLRYPDLLRSSGTDGEVLAQFIVDTNGVALPETFKVLKSTHVLFAQAVRDALPAMRFTPATIGGRRVPQLVQKPFYFTVTR